MDRNDCIKHCRYYTGSAENTFSDNESFFWFWEKKLMELRHSRHFMCMNTQNLQSICINNYRNYILFTPKKEFRLKIPNQTVFLLDAPILITFFSIDIFLRF